MKISKILFLIPSLFIAIDTISTQIKDFANSSPASNTIKQATIIPKFFDLLQKKHSKVPALNEQVRHLSSDKLPSIEYKPVRHLSSDKLPSIEYKPKKETFFEKLMNKTNSLLQNLNSNLRNLNSEDFWCALEKLTYGTFYAYSLQEFFLPNLIIKSQETKLGFERMLSLCLTASSTFNIFKGYPFTKKPIEAFILSKRGFITTFFFSSLLCYRKYKECLPFDDLYSPMFFCVYNYELNRFYFDLFVSRSEKSWRKFLPSKEILAISVFQVIMAVPVYKKTNDISSFEKASILFFLFPIFKASADLFPGAEWNRDEDEINSP